MARMKGSVGGAMSFRTARDAGMVGPKTLKERIRVWRMVRERKQWNKLAHQPVDLTPRLKKRDD